MTPPDLPLPSSQGETGWGKSRAQKWCQGQLTTAAGGTTVPKDAHVLTSRPVSYVTWQGRDSPCVIWLRTVRREVSLDYPGGPCHHKGPPKWTRKQEAGSGRCVADHEAGKGATARRGGASRSWRGKKRSSPGASSRSPPAALDLSPRPADRGTCELCAPLGLRSAATAAARESFKGAPGFSGLFHFTVSEVAQEHSALWRSKSTKSLSHAFHR